MPMLSPEKEGLAYQRLVRIGAMTPQQMIRERGGDPDTQMAEYAEFLTLIDGLGIKLDSDPRNTTAAGMAQPEDDPGTPVASEDDE